MAVVTGGVGAIGAAIALDLAGRGAHLALFDTDTGADKLASLPASGEEAHMALQTDVTDEAAVDTAVAAVLERYGRIDILVNCAGIVLRQAGNKPSIRDIDLDSWRRSLDVNLTSVFVCARAVIGSMSARRWGRIVTLSSQGGRTGGIFSSVDYGAAKAGVIGLSRTLAIEVGPLGITVNCVAPGRVETPMTAHQAEQARNAGFISSLPIPRMAQREEIAATVAFLCSEEAGYITGATVDVNGGGFMA